MNDVTKTKEISDVTLASECDEENLDAIECALEMVGMEFFTVTITTDDRNEDSVSVMQLTKTKWAEATDTCQISYVKYGYSTKKHFQNL